MVRGVNEWQRTWEIKPDYVPPFGYAEYRNLGRRSALSEKRTPVEFFIMKTAHVSQLEFGDGADGIQPQTETALVTGNLVALEATHASSELHTDRPLLVSASPRPRIAALNKA